MLKSKLKYKKTENKMQDFLKKPEEISVNENNPFENDKMQREELIKLYTNLLSNTNQAFTICLSAPWGGGKTVFIKMWEKYLNKNDFLTINYNAWEGEFTNDPFISLVAEINLQLENMDIGIGIIKKLNKEAGKLDAKKIVNIAAKISSGIDLTNFLSLLENDFDERIKNYKNHKKNY